MQTRDVYAGADSVHIIDDYGGAIKAARAARGMDVEAFAASISEKKGILAKVEANDLVPDDKLLRKIEKALDIKLTEAVQSAGSLGGAPSGGKMTLANFIRKERRGTPRTPSPRSPRRPPRGRGALSARRRSRRR